MGNCRSELRTAIRSNDVTRVRQILADAGHASSDLINDDYTSNCLFGCLMRNNLSPLHTTVIFQQADMTSLLLQHGADVDARTYWRQSPLHLAMRFNNYPAAMMLIQVYKADLSAQDIDGNTPLHIAAITEDVPDSQEHDLMALILQTNQKELLRLTDDDGNTPLHKACMADYDRKVLQLLQHGGDVNQRNNNGLSALEVAQPKAKTALETFIQKNNRECKVHTA